MTKFLMEHTLTIGSNQYRARYYKNILYNGRVNYSVEIFIDDNDRIILDDISLERLEWRIQKVLSFAIFSRQLFDDDTIKEAEVFYGQDKAAV
jgi:hypothetical protein